MMQLPATEQLRTLALTGDGVSADLLFGHSAEIYLEGGATVEKRLALLALVERYAARSPDDVVLFHPRNSRRLRKMADTDWVGHYRQIAETLGPDDIEGFDATVYGFVGGQDTDEATPHYCGVVGSPAYLRFSRAHAYFPLGDPSSEAQNKAFVALMVDWCSLVGAAHATFGLSVILEEGGPKTTGSALAFPLLKRFPGLDFPNPGRWSVNARKATGRTIRTINWLTAIDDGFVAVLGGRAVLEKQLSLDCEVHPYKNGLVLQAGRQPQLGDTNRGLIPPAYQSVARALAPVVFEGFRPNLPYLVPPKPLDPVDETLKWLHRFD